MYSCWLPKAYLLFEAEELSLSVAWTPAETDTIVRTLAVYDKITYPVSRSERPHLLGWDTLRLSAKSHAVATITGVSILSHAHECMASQRKRE